MDIHSKAVKQLQKLPEKIQLLAFQVVSEIEELGPNRGNWPNFSGSSAKLVGILRHFL